MKPTTIRSTGSWRERVLLAAAALLIALLASTPAHGQLDPLIALKRVPPRVVIVFDTSFEMLYDANWGGTVYCDPVLYTRATDPNMANALGVPGGQATYRRYFSGLRIESDGSYSATGVAWYDDSASPCGHTRMEIARAGVALALRRSGNPRLHFGLVRLRQVTPVWRTAPSTLCEKVKVVDSAGSPIYSRSDSAPCAVGAGYVAFNPAANGGTNASAGATPAHVPSAANTAASLITNVFEKPLLQSPLIATGRSTATIEDRPLALTLDDARSEVVRAMAAASETGLAAHRNTVVVLIAGGKDFTGDPVAKAATFLNVGGGGATKRVPIFVVGVSPKAAHEDQLRQIASASGGLYARAFTPEAVERVINLALQAGCQRPADFNSGLASEYPLVSPVVGTVNLVNAKSATGEDLPNTTITTSAGIAIPQRNNIMLTASFALGRGSLTPGTEGGNNPGFEGRLRAYRVFKPVPDNTKPSGYTFTKDGTPLWPDVDGRSWLAGLARVPTTSAMRNIYTYIPGQGVVAFHTDNQSLIGPALALTADKAGWESWLINLVRNQPLGGIISSTPAVMDPPSLDPPPDDDYGRSDASGTYAYRHKDRRSIIFVGANDGMLHAIDARTGIELWAFIPYNLLPKLQTLFSGQSPYEFSYFVDQSPKIAEVKMAGQWRSVLIIGEGWGGTFYQAFDVTDAGDGGPAPDSDNWSGALATFGDASRIRYMWSFPQYEHFDPTLVAKRIPVADTTSFGRVKFFGDLNASATVAEKKVGFTWSDPAVGALDTARSVNAAIVGSGYFPREAEVASSPDALPNRIGAGVGRALYLINVATGALVGNSSGGCSGTGCLDVGDAGGNRPKNALQADPTVTSDYGSYVAKKAYMGDLQGNYYRFDFNASGSITKTVLKATGQPIYASSALMWVGSTQQYIFFATGSDMLPTSPPSTFGIGTFAMYGLKDSGGTVSDAFTKADMAGVTNATPENPVVNDTNNKAIGIPAGERPSTSPSVAGEIVFFTTTVEGGVPAAGTAVGIASAEPTYNFYALTYSGSNGYPAVGSGSGSGGSGKGNKSGGGTAIAPVKTGTGRATAPFVVDQHLYFATSSGSGANVEAFGDPNDFNNGVGQVGVRILSWREIRR